MSRNACEEFDFYTFGVLTKAEIIMILIAAGTFVETVIQVVIAILAYFKEKENE